MQCIPDNFTPQSNIREFKLKNYLKIKTATKKSFEIVVYINVQFLDRIPCI